MAKAPRKTASSPKPGEVFFGSTAVSQSDANATLPAKLKRILARFDLGNLAQGAWVPIKMHLGGGLGYTTIHPAFVRVVVNAVKEAGGKPFLVDGYFDTIVSAHERGYTPETVGCPLVAAGGPFNSHVIRKDIGYRTYDYAGIFGAIHDAKCLINFSHVKGHGACGYGGACKNIAMGCVDQRTRGKIHGLEGGIDWDEKRCVFCGRCVKACDTGDTVTFRDKAGTTKLVKACLELKSGYEAPDWIAVDGKSMTAKIVRLPVRADVRLPVNEQLVVEFYSR